MVAGISMYFRFDRINIRKGTLIALGRPHYVHLRVNEKKKLLFIIPCEKDRDAFRIYYKDSDEAGKESPLRCYINAKKVMDYLAKVVGVDRYSESLRFSGEVVERENRIYIDLTKYDVIPYPEYKE